MKFSYIILVLTLHFCNVNEKKKQQNEIYYFYFENNNSTMNYIYSSKKNRKKYFYNIKKADYIYFDAVKNNNNFIVKKIKDPGWCANPFAFQINFVNPAVKSLTSRNIKKPFDLERLSL